MIFAIIFGAMVVVGISGEDEYTPSIDTNWFEFVSQIPSDLFDGPAHISSEETIPAKVMLPTEEQMMYYNYYVAATYCPYEVEDLTCEYCDKFKGDIDEYDIFKNNVHHTMAIVTASNLREEIVVAYRGSMDPWNYVLDFLFLNHSRHKIKFHTGFLIATESLYDEIVDKIAYHRFLHPNYKIVLTGHSLGGAIARLTLFFLLETEHFPGATFELYTYGEPRVGNKAFADYFNNLSITTARVVARADIVPHAPPTSILGTTVLSDYYVHPQPEYWIDSISGQRFCNQSSYEDPDCSNSLGPAYNYLDHITYFDVNYMICTLSNSAALFGPSFNLPQAVEIFPPLPNPISKLLGNITEQFFRLL